MKIFDSIRALRLGRRIRLGFVLLVSFLTIVGVASTATAGEMEIRCHQPECTIDLVPGADRGTITQRLFTGTITSTGATVHFVITDASDKDFAETFGAIRADSLEEAPDAAVESASFNNGSWTFFEDPGLVARFSSTGEALPPVANPNYSPLKRIEWNGRTVTINVPFVKWGDGPGQQLLIDQGKCDPLIRSNPPSPFFVGDGPTNGADCSTEGPLDRYKGGQVVDLDLDAMTVTMKLHKATFDHPDKIPYYTAFDASKAPPAGFMGVIHAPKVMGRIEDGKLVDGIGRFGDNDAVGRIAQFSNGVRNDAGGPNRYQQGITSYRGGQQGTYSPMWHISWIFFDCDGDGVFFRTDRNVGEGATPVPGSGISGFDPADPATFDPFQMEDKGVNCEDFAAQVTGNSDGFIEDLNHLDFLIANGDAI